MKKTFLMGLMAMSVVLASCDKDDEVEKSMPEGTSDVTLEIDEVNVTSANVKNWTEYAQHVAKLLEDDATTLYKDWSESYKGGDAFAVQFKNHQAPYSSASACVEQIIDGCIDIANEVGTAKIGDPRDLWEKSKYTEAVYAVESWYSYHSIEDYSNNIRSIQNAFNGSRAGGEAAHSLAAYLKKNNTSLYNEVKSAIDMAISSIEGMAAPFRSHIGNSSVLSAQDACAALNTVLENKLKSYISGLADSEEDELDAIVDNYVDQVVLPTYKQLMERNATLHAAIKALKGNPSDANFKTAANAWLSAREPWEKSEAFLFGPVDEEGLDPNMDSWPLDQAAIQNILNSGDFSDLVYGDDANDEAVEAAQNVRGFHTLEFLLFKDGQHRCLK